MDIIDYLNGIASYNVLTDEKRCLIIHIWTGDENISSILMIRLVKWSQIRTVFLIL